MQLKFTDRIALIPVSILVAYFALSVPRTVQAADGCLATKAVEDKNGQRRLALVVGVGKFKNEDIKSLPGATKDGERVFKLLTERIEQGGYGFPLENVCYLRDDAATLGAFNDKFANLLLKLKGRDPKKHNDVVVVYFSGHGSQLPTKDLEDEPDGLDETLVFHDAKEDGTGMLVDDDFGKKLRTLYQLTHNVAVILDSCNSASATRGDESGVTVRFYNTPNAARTTIYVPVRDWSRKLPITDKRREEMSEMVILAAAPDGKSAYETFEGGFFTNAMIKVLAATRAEPMTYAEAEDKIRDLLRDKSLQVPYVEGNREKVVFGVLSRLRPLSLEVKSITVGGDKRQRVTLEGTPLPGMGIGAQLRIFSGKVGKIDVGNPAESLATVVVESTSGISSRAVVSAKGPKGGDIEVGFLAVLVRPSDDYVRLRVRIRSKDAAGGVPQSRAARIRTAVAADKQTDALVKFVQVKQDPADFELALGSDDRIQLRDEADEIRVQYDPGSVEAEQIAKNLRAHAVQRALLQLEGEGGKHLKDGQTLKVTVVPLGPESNPHCKKWAASADQATPSDSVSVPLCSCYKIHVELVADVPQPLQVGGLVLSADGSISTLSTLKTTLAKKGEVADFMGPLGGGFQATLPVDGVDRILVVGNDPRQPIPWEQFTDFAGLKGNSGESSGLFRALSDYMTPGARAKPISGNAEDLPWTKSVAAIRVRANDFFREARGESDPFDPREFTLQRFDIGPYLPDNKSSVLYRLLNEVTNLTAIARQKGLKGVSYKQHDWKQQTETQNLELGIDCSRALWYVFNKAGLPYNRKSKPTGNLTANDTNDYLSTGEMLGSYSRMNDEFDSCYEKSVQIGDILVYRDNDNKFGHTVMVIDPSTEKLYAWGSHGYDSSAKKLGREPDTGVEFQKIKSSRDWRRWDRIDMQLKACWRYRKLDKELGTFAGRPGLKVIADACGSS